MDLDLARVRSHPEVPLRRQLAAWLASGIRDGEVAGDERLPSARRLAELVGVHRNTAWAAYVELARQGLVRRVEGSGVYAVSAPRRPAPCQQCGWLPGSPARGTTGSRRHATGTASVAVVEPGAGLRAVLVAELRWLLAGRGVDVRGIGSPRADLPRRPRHASAVPVPVPRRSDRSSGRGSGGRRSERSSFAELDPALPVGLPATCRRLVSGGAAELAPEPLSLRGGREELRLVADLRTPAVVAVLTVSSRVRAFARELLAGWAGVGLFVPRRDDRPAVARALRVADLVFADACFGVEGRSRELGAGSSAGGSSRRRSRSRMVAFRCIRAESLRRVAARLGLDPSAGPRGGGNASSGVGPAARPGVQQTMRGSATCATRSSTRS